MEKSANGFRTPFYDLVNESLPGMIRLARSIAGLNDAEDIVQETLIIAWKKLPGLKQPEKFPWWIRRILVRRAVSFARKNRNSLTLPEEIPADPFYPDSMLDIEKALSILAPRQRAVLHMTVIEGMSDGEIASILKIRAGSVRAHRRRARKKLNHFLGEYDEKSG